MHWRTRRKLYYTTAALLPLLIVVGIVYYNVFFSAPTCFDGVQNGNETGVDCGGNCERICQSDTASTTIKWAQAFPVSGDIYNLAAVIQNPNVSLAAESVPYQFKVYDKDGLLITERRGRMDVLPQPKTLAFAGGVDTEGRTIDRVEFAWREAPFWQESDLAAATFPIRNKTLTGPTSSVPRLTFDVQNRSVRDYTNVVMSALIRDGTGRPVQVSQTKIGKLPSRSTKSAVMTWRQPLPTRDISCQVPADIMLLIDRSGSMNDQGSNPPQPITAVRDAAVRFVNLLGEPARSGLVSFAEDSQVDQPLTDTHTQTRSAVEGLFIRPEDERTVTNMGAAIQSANGQLQSGQADERSDVIVLLTDGKANAPDPPGGEEFARSQIQEARDAGVVVYTIGLGGDVNQRFLRDIATSPSHYFQIADREALTDIYTQIHEDLCEQAPYVTEIIPSHYELAQ